MRQLWINELRAGSVGESSGSFRRLERGLSSSQGHRHMWRRNWQFRGRHAFRWLISRKLRLARLPVRFFADAVAMELCGNAGLNAGGWVLR